MNINENNIDDSISLMAAVKNKANAFIMNELHDDFFENMSYSHGDILVTLFIHGEFPMKDIAKNIKKDPSTVTALVNKLTKAGYIASKRSEKDSRVNLIYLTDKGKALEPKFKEVSQALFKKQYEGISVEERETFKKILLKMYNNF